MGMSRCVRAWWGVGAHAGAHVGVGVGAGTGGAAGVHVLCVLFIVVRFMTRVGQCHIYLRCIYGILAGK